MIALIGGDGSIGRRYQAVLNFLQQPYRVIEKGDAKEGLDGCQKALICTPTEEHMNWAWECCYRKIPFLCEKPFGKSTTSARTLKERGAEGYVVNNWAFVARNFDNQLPTSLSYNFYNTGKDGLIWDVSQLILLADQAGCVLEVRTDSYCWEVEWSGARVPYAFIEQSYLHMLRAFLQGETQSLWNLEKAYRMTEVCEAIERSMRETGGVSEHFTWDPGTKQIHAFAGKSFREDRTEIGAAMGV